MPALQVLTSLIIIREVHPYIILVNLNDQKIGQTLNDVQMDTYYYDVYAWQVLKNQWVTKFHYNHWLLITIF